MQPEEDYIVSYGEPSGPEEVPGKRKPLRENSRFRALTFIVMILAILWIIGVGLGLHPSRLTFVGFLACLVFYSGEYIAWERPRIPKRPKREPKQHHQWRDR